MSISIALLDSVSAMLFFAAAVITVVAAILSGSRTASWAWTALAFGLFAVDRTLNALEWSAPANFAWLDFVQGYFAVAACVALAWITVQFWLVASRASRAAAGQP